MNRNQLRAWATEFPVGHPTRGAAFGEKCDPATLTVLQIAGTAMSVVGALSGASSASSAAKYNAQLNQQNAQIATQQGDAQAIQQRRLDEMRMGTIRAGYGASGVVGGEGSPLDVLSSSAAQAELDTQNVIYNSRLKAMGYTNNAILDQSRAAAASSKGLYGAASAALIGGTKAYGMYTAGTGTQIPSYGAPNGAGDAIENLG